MNVLSLFDGMSCGQLALKKNKITVNKYYAAEIDKYAIAVTQKNFPNTIQLGDVTKISAKNLDKIDLLIGGSPCQGFSFAGKQLNFGDPRSALFFEYVRIWKEIKEINPNAFFLLENVNMKKEHLRVISEYMGVFPARINSNLVSAQNRDRWYWTNIRTKDVGLFDELWSDIPQPEDKGILLKDILQPEEDVEEKYYIKNPKAGFNGMDINRKGNNLRIRGQRSQSKKHNYDIIKLDIKGNQKADQDKAGCLTGGGHSGGNHSDMDILCVAMRGRNSEDPNDRKTGSPTEQRLEPKTDGKTNCLTSVAKDNLIIQKIGNIYPSGGENGNIYSTEGKSPTIKSGETSTKGNRGIGSSNSPKIIYNYKLRRLTPIECERLQTVPYNKISCIFTLCLDQVKNYVNAVEKNPKLLKLALSAEKKELSEFVKLVTPNTTQNHLKTRFIVPKNADITTRRQINQCTKVSQKENNTTVSNAGNIVMSKNQKQEVDSVLSNAFINITEGRTTHFGKEELLQKDKNWANQMNGSKPLVLFGKEIMELVKDVGAGMKKNSDMISTSTILSVLSVNSLEQMLAIYYLFVKNAITGYTQNKTLQKSLSVQFQINDGYTSCVSDTQRYRMLGNGWTVDVIAHIFSFLT